MRGTQSQDWYIVVNKEGKAFTGLSYRKFLFTDNWDQAKPLRKENTSLLLREPGSELIKLEDLGWLSAVFSLY